MKTGKHIIRTIAFLLVLAIAIWVVPGKVFSADSAVSYLRTQGFFAERTNSLDAVFVGASNVYHFWQPAIGWHGHGIAIYNLAYPSMPITCFRYLITEARKTQPNALYIINLNNFKSRTITDRLERFHTIVDYMPFTQEKVRFIKTIAELSGFSLKDQAELLLPFIRFHSRWDALKSWSYGVQKVKYKSSKTGNSAVQGVQDVSDEFVVYDTVRVMPLQGAQQVLEDLLDYLDQERVNALFVTVPQVISMENQGHLNVLENMVERRGYPCLDMLSDYEAVGIDPRRDFYDKSHTNIHGSIKVTDYLADYLVEHYQFADKRGQADYADWDSESEAYDKLMDTWILPFEREHAPWRDIEAPKVEKPVVDGQNIQLAWSASKGADGYVIYRKTKAENNERWTLLAMVGADTLSYVDGNLEYATQYTYSIAPYVEEDGQRAYGNYSIKGVSGKTPREDTIVTDDSSEGGTEA